MDAENKAIEKAVKDPNAFGEIVDTYSQKIYNFIYSALRNEENAKDITQEVFIKAWKNLSKFDLDKNFSVWIYTIARNTLIDFYRKKKSIPFGSLNKDDEEDFESNIPDTLPLPDEIFEKKEIKEMLDTALETLPAKDRMIISLHNNDGLTFEEVSEILEISVNTIKSRYRRALLKLREILVNAPK